MKPAPENLPQPLFSLHAERIAGALRDRFVGGQMRLPGRHWRVVLLESGAATLIEGDREDHWTGPAVRWLPWRDGMRLKLKAGSTGAVLFMGEQVVANAIGHKPEAFSLRVFSERPAQLDLADRPDLLDRLSHGFEQIFEELERRAPGAELIIEAQVRVMLVLIWRLMARPEEQAAAPAATRLILLRFRQHLEIRFRERWSVARYARHLNMSSDRLHDLCTRHLHRPPLKLINERLGHEAQILLERSSLTNQQIAEHLGFTNAPQFNTFFKTLYGMPPGAFRKSRQAFRSPRTTTTRSYADWP